MAAPSDTFTQLDRSIEATEHLVVMRESIEFTHTLVGSSRQAIWASTAKLQRADELLQDAKWLRQALPYCVPKSLHSEAIDPTAV